MSAHARTCAHCGAGPTSGPVDGACCWNPIGCGCGVAGTQSASAQLRQVQQALAASQADITQVERQLADAEGERMKAERERDEARAATERWADRAARALTSLTATREQRDLARAELEQLREALAAARDDRDFVEREMTGAREELARSDRRHLDLDSELARARTELRTLRDHQEIRAQVIRERNAELRAIRQALGIDMLAPPPDAVETIRELRAAQGWIVARDGGRDCVRCEQEIRRGEAYELMPGVDELQHVHCPTPEPKES